MEQKTLISDSTAGETYSDIIVHENKKCTIATSGLAGSEVATLQILINGTYVNVYDPTTNELVTMAADGNIITIDSPGLYAVVLDATASAASVEFYSY